MKDSVFTRFQSSYPRGRYIIGGVVFVMLIIGSGYGLIHGNDSRQLRGVHRSSESSVLGTTTSLPTGTPVFRIGILSDFADMVRMGELMVRNRSVFAGITEFQDEVILAGRVTIRNDLTADGADIDLGDGSLTASNVLYSLTPGSGLSISGTQDLTITNTDPGSAQHIFKKIKVGDETIEASENGDMLTLAAGTGIALSRDGDTVTFSGSNPSGWIAQGSYAVLADTTSRVGIGTTSPTNILEINGGATGASGVTLTQLNSSSAAGVGGGKVLSVDSGGRIILVEDQTGDTPTAESVLPSATTGMTLYFNGVNWTASNNLFHDGGSVGISNASPDGRLHISTNLASKVGLIVQADVAQTANLQEWRDSNGNAMAYISASGAIHGTFQGTVNGDFAGTMDPGFSTGSVVFQSATGLAQDNGNLYWDDVNNRLGIGTNSPSALFSVGAGSAFQVNSIGIVTGNSFRATNASGASSFGGSALSNRQVVIYAGAATTTPLTVRGATSQTANLSEWQQSNGAVLSIVDPAGRVGIGTGAVTLGSALQVQGSGSTSASSSFNVTNSTGTSALFVRDDGNVGIGTTSPTARLHVASTGTSLSANGLSYLNWNPSSASTFVGDLVGINVGANATVNGNLFSVRNNGSLLFGVSQSKITSALPHEFTAAGDVSMAYDLNFTNSTVANITSNASLYLNAGPVYASSDLVLKTYNSGNVVIDSRALNIGGGVTRGLLSVDNTTKAATGKALVSLNQAENQDMFTASSSGTTRFVIKNDGSVGIGTTSPTTKLHVSSDIGVGGGTILRLQNTNASSVNVYDFALNGAKQLTIAGGASSNDAVLFENSLYVGMGSSTNIGIGTTTPTSKLHVNGAVVGKALVMLDETGNQDIFTASASGTTRFTIKNDGKVGIGTSSPTAMMEIPGSNWNVSLKVGSQTAYSGSPDVMQVIGASGVGLRVTTNGEVVLGTGCNSVNGPANCNVGVLAVYGTGAPGRVVQHIRGTTSQTADILQVANSASQMLLNVQASGNVGVGTASATAKFHVRAAGTGNIAVFESDNNTGCTLSDGGVIACSSDARLKENIAALPEGLGLISQLNPSTFTWINSDGRTQAGFIAQSVESVLPDLVMTNASGYKSVSMTGMIPYLVRAVQQQQTQIDALHAAQTEAITTPTLANHLTAWIEEFKTVVALMGDTMEFRIAAVFTKPVEFQDAVTFAQSPKFTDQNIAGKAIIPTGGRVVQIPFDPALGVSEPLISITPHVPGVQYAIENASASGFTLRLAEDAPQDLGFTWLVTIVDDFRTIIGPTPQPSPSTLPVTTPEPSATPTGDLVPTPTPVATTETSQGTESATTSE